MRTSYLSMMLCAAFAAASPVEKRGSDLPQLPAYVQDTFSTGHEITIFYFNENPNQASHFGIQGKPGVWLASNLHPVCIAYCLSPAFAAADPQRYGKHCYAPYCTTVRSFFSVSNSVIFGQQLYDSDADFIMRDNRQ